MAIDTDSIFESKSNRPEPRRRISVTLKQAAEYGEDPDKSNRGSETR